MFPNYDFHIHTVLCGHCDPAQTVPNILKQADALGLPTIAITEHIMQPSQRELIDIIRDQVQACEHNCEVLIGAEIDADSKHGDGSLVFDDPDGLDIILGSLHYFPGTDIMPHCQPMLPMDQTEIIARWSKALLGLAQNPIIDYIAHPGALIASALKCPNFDNLLDTFTQAAQLSAQNNIAWEINNLIGMKLTEQQRPEYWRVLKTAQDQGVTLVFGSDAHRPSDLARHDFVSTLLPKLGHPDLSQIPPLKSFR
ncbi:MAG: PHP domain-containing protein [Sedimentisphaerales bacterium]|nr:PHP domain-containing protein [Sedimentisphaerales bacterium]